MDYATLIGDIILAIATAVAAYIARQSHHNSRRLAQNTQRLELLTDADLDKRIREAVVEVLSAQEGQSLAAHVRTVLRHRDIPSDE